MSYVHLNATDGIGTIEFSTKESNSLPRAILKKLEETVTAAGKDTNLKVIILKSEGQRTFCAGASFNELMTIEDESSGKEFFMGFASVINAMRKAPKFIIGRVQGKAVGGGIGLAAATDYCFATQYSAIKLSELSLGIGPFVVGPVIERKIGLSAMSQMSLNANDFYDAKWAYQKGLFAKLYDDAVALDKAVSDLACRLAKYNPEAMTKLKRAFWEGTEHWDELLAERAQVSGSLVTSNFTKAFIQQFKRK